MLITVGGNKMVNHPIYLDNNATTPCDPRVVEKMLPFFSDHFGNPASRTHFFGWEAAEAVRLGREEVAALVGAEPEEIIFTSGATESLNLAIRGAFEQWGGKGNHIITCATEHKAVLDCCRHLEKFGALVTYLPVDSAGRIRLKDLEEAITSKTMLIAIMYANNEVGVLQPVEEISRIARNRKIWFLCDATQAVGKLPVNVGRDGMDIMAFSAHKINGPKGVGALYLKRKNPRISISPQIDGGGHEKGLRSGTLNVPGIVGFGKACTLCLEFGEEEGHNLGLLRNQLEAGLLDLGNTSVNGSKEFRLPQVTNISFQGVNGNRLMAAVADQLAVSSGSACTSAQNLPSYVLKAMGLDDDRANSSIRFSLGRFNTRGEIETTLEIMKTSLYRLRGESLGEAPYNQEKFQVMD
ncbi:MAG: cysteine desulfurase family protein [Chitinophagaceae bacterium]